MKNKKLIFSFIISFIYVLLGTITVMVSFPEYSLLGFDYNSILWIPLVVLTLPVNILLFGLVMVDISFPSIFILQLIIFLITWFAFYKIRCWVGRKRE